MIKKAQGVLEYALFAAAIIVGLIAFKAYFLRSYGGHLKKYSDALGSGKQFSYKYSSYDEIKESLAYNTSVKKGLQAGLVHQLIQQEAGYLVTKIASLKKNKYNQPEYMWPQIDSQIAALQAKVDKIIAKHLGVFVNTTNIEAQITQTVGGKISETTVTDEGVDTSDMQDVLENTNIYKEMQADFPEFKEFVENKELGKMPGNYSVTDRTTVVDDFSDKRLAEDNLYE